MATPEPPDDNHAREVCRIGQGAACCRYLTMGARGWSCEKKTSIGLLLDMRALRGQMIAVSDNCEGRGSR